MSRVPRFYRCWESQKIQALFRGWNIASFILGLVFVQSLTHIAAISNLMSYLMDVLEEKLPQAAATTNIRMGVTAIAAIFAAFLADVRVGSYQIILYSTVIYFIGLSLLTLSASHFHSKTTKAYISSEELCVFRVGLLLTALGKAGHAPVLKAFGADQLKPSNEDGDRELKTRVNIWWFTGVNLGAVAGIILLAVIEGNQEWVLGYGFLALNILVAFGVFICGKSSYTCVEPRGSVLRGASRVLVAAMLKRRLKCPTDVSHLYHGEDNQLLPHTARLRFLDKASIIESPSHDLKEQEYKWRLCTVREVEETKLLLHMFPMWTAFLFYGLVKSLGSTFFLQQGSNMNRNLGHIRIPLPFLFIFSRVSKVQISYLCKKLPKKYPGLEQVLTPTWRIGIGMFFSVLCCGTASSVEIKRLDVIKKHGLLERPKETLPMSIFWLAPQFLLLGVMDGFTYPGIEDFFCDQVPKSMRNFGPSFSVSVIGVGCLLGVIVIAASDKASRLGGHRSWFSDTINRSHLDYYYWTLTILCYLNLVFYGFISSKYTYKKLDAQDEPDIDIDVISI